MNNTNTGGPAFPQDYEHAKVLVQMQQTGDISAKDLQKLSKQLAGMTLRDYFAAKAMQGLVAGAAYNEPINLHGAAEWSYNMADAMLKARG